MKRLSELDINQTAIVKKITAKEPVKGRLNAMGIVKGVKIKVLKHTLTKQTWDILVDSTKVGLREEEAKNIIIEKSDD